MKKIITSLTLLLSFSYIYADMLTLTSGKSVCGDVQNKQDGVKISLGSVAALVPQEDVKAVDKDVFTVVTTAGQTYRGHITDTTDTSVIMRVNGSQIVLGSDDIASMALCRSSQAQFKEDLSKYLVKEEMPAVVQAFEPEVLPAIISEPDAVAETNLQTEPTAAAPAVQTATVAPMADPALEPSAADTFSKETLPEPQPSAQTQNVIFEAKPVAEDKLASKPVADASVGAPSAAQASAAKPAPAASSKTPTIYEDAHKDELAQKNEKQIKAEEKWPKVIGAKAGYWKPDIKINLSQYGGREKDKFSDNGFAFGINYFTQPLNRVYIGLEVFLLNSSGESYNFADCRVKTSGDLILAMAGAKYNLTKGRITPYVGASGGWVMSSLNYKVETYASGASEEIKADKSMPAFSGQLGLTAAIGSLELNAEFRYFYMQQKEDILDASSDGSYSFTVGAGWKF